MRKTPTEPKIPHPYDGKIVRVYRRDIANQGYWQYGLVEFVTDETYLHITLRGNFQNFPEEGCSIVRHLKKNGKPGAKWEYIFHHPLLWGTPVTWEIYSGPLQDRPKDYLAERKDQVID
jgi:hypothetical protein